jgi:hypothetical protein
MGDQDADAKLVERLIAGNAADVKGIIDVVVREAKAGEPVTELFKRLWVVPRARWSSFRCRRSRPSPT